MNVLVTGASGFVGRHLVKELRNDRAKIKAVGHQADAIEGAEYTQLNLLDAGAVANYSFSGIDVIIHLAGLAAVGPSFKQARHYIDANAGMQINICEALLAQAVNPRVIIVSSGGLYDPANLPLTESSALLPKNPYAVSKMTQELLTQYYVSRGLKLIIARPFNHIGPGQAEGFIVADLAKQVAAAEQGKTRKIKVGNLASKRDYTDVRDIARAYVLLAHKGRLGETYNVCSGTSHSGQEILDGLSKHATCELKVVSDPALMRPSDIPDIYGSYQKLKQDTGWKPSIPLSKTLKDTLDDWRRR